MANTIPNTGGVVSFFTGGNDIDTFGAKLATFGKAMKDYADAISGMDVEAVVNSATAGKAIVELANTLPNTGGLVSWFTGDNDIGDEKNKAVNRAVMKFMNLAGISGSALGNHELDTKQKDFVDTINGFNGDYFAVNLKQSPIETQDPDDVEEQEHIELNKFIKKIFNYRGERGKNRFNRRCSN